MPTNPPNGPAPGLFERLMGARQTPPAGRAGLEQLKDGVARDLEALLNTRAACSPARFDAYPQARASVLNYGLPDVAAFNLSSSEDRAAICASLKDVIERHEPRLANVSATLQPDAGSVNRLAFVIHATLRIEGADEPVDFNAMLQPSSLRYAISKPSFHPKDRRWTST